MAFAHYLMAAAPVVETSHPNMRNSILTPSPLPPSISNSLLSIAFSSFQPNHKASKLSFFSKFRKIGQKVKAKAVEAEVPAVDSFSQFKHLLLPITDRNPYLSEGSRQLSTNHKNTLEALFLGQSINGDFLHVAAATTASLAKKYGAEITVVVIDEKEKESYPEHETQLSSIRWHLSEGGFQEFKLLERLGEGKKPTAIIGEVADDMNLDLVVMSMEAIHSKHVDANLLAEFIPCPVLLLPL